MTQHTRSPDPNIKFHIDALKNASNSTLKAEWREFYRTPPPKQMSSPMMRRFIAYELQAKTIGGLSKRQLKSLVTALKPTKTSRVRFNPGTRLVRDWRGVTYEVMVTAKGYRWHGKDWRSLSAVAKAITGAHRSGPRFFGISHGPRS